MSRAGHLFGVYGSCAFTSYPRPLRVTSILPNILLLQLLLFLTLATFPVPVTALTLINKTLDDSLSSSDPTLKLSYFGAWNVGQDCPACFVQPDKTKVLDGTWHDATAGTGSNEPQGNIGVTVNFVGTAVYVYCVLANTIPFTSTKTTLSFTLDGQPSGPGFSHIPSSDSSYQYNALVYSQASLSNGAHKLQITLAPTGSGVDGASLMLLDYVRITQVLDDGTTTISTTTTTKGSTTSSTQSGANLLPTASLPSNSSALSPTSDPQAGPDSPTSSSSDSPDSNSDHQSSDSNTNTHSNVVRTNKGAIIGGVIAAILAIALIIVGVLLWVRKKKEKERGYEPTPFTSTPTRGSVRSARSAPTSPGFVAPVAPMAMSEIGHEPPLVPNRFIGDGGSTRSYFTSTVTGTGVGSAIGSSEGTSAQERYRLERRIDDMERTIGLLEQNSRSNVNVSANAGLGLGAGYVNDSDDPFSSPLPSPNQSQTHSSPPTSSIPPAAASQTILAPLRYNPSGQGSPASEIYSVRGGEDTESQAHSAIVPPSRPIAESPSFLNLNQSPQTESHYPPTPSSNTNTDLNTPRTLPTPSTPQYDFLSEVYPSPNTPSTSRDLNRRATTRTVGTIGTLGTIETLPEYEPPPTAYREHYTHPRGGEGEDGEEDEEDD